MVDPSEGLKSTRLFRVKRLRRTGPRSRARGTESAAGSSVVPLGVPASTSVEAAANGMYITANPSEGFGSDLSKRLAFLSPVALTGSTESVNPVDGRRDAMLEAWRFAAHGAARHSES